MYLEFADTRQEWGARYCWCTISVWM